MENKKSNKTVNIIMAVVLALIVIGGALYYFLVVKSDSTKNEPETNVTANSTTENANTTQANTTQPQAQPQAPEYETILSEIYKDPGNRFTSRYPSDYSLIEDDGVRVQYGNAAGMHISFRCDINSKMLKPEDVIKEVMDSPIIVTSDVKIDGDIVSYNTSRANGECSYNYYILRNNYIYGYTFSYNEGTNDYSKTLEAIKQCAADGKLLIIN